MKLTVWAKIDGNNGAASYRACLDEVESGPIYRIFHKPGYYARLCKITPGEDDHYPREVVIGEYTSVDGAKRAAKKDAARLP